MLSSPALASPTPSAVFPFSNGQVDYESKYKAYLLESGYASDQTDGRFIKVAKLKRKNAMSNDGCRKRGSSVKKKKINFVSTWDPMFPDINEALRKFQHILEEDDGVETFSRKDHSGFRTKEAIRI